jgi:hydrogenase/urease accessory protein HupE
VTGWLPRLGLAAVAVVLAPATAYAHLANSGLGPFYDGLLHFSMSPGEILPVLALGLLAGRRGAAAGRMAVLALAAAWLTGRMVGMPPVAGMAPAYVAAVTLGLGALVALDPSLPRTGVTALAAGLGWLQGAMFGVDDAIGGAGAGATVGAYVASIVVVLLAAGQASALREQWTRSAVRVAGSWIAAAGLLMLGWQIRGT